MSSKHLLGAAVAAAALVVLLTPGSAGAGVDECVRKKVAQGETSTKAMTECLANNNSTPTLPRNTSSSSSGDDGTSTGLLLVVGLVGVAVGALGATMLRKQKGTGTAPAAAAATPVAAMPPPGFGAPPMTAPTAPDRSQPLVSTLVDLSDRVSSGALRAEIVAALAQAGVQALEPAQGSNFDASTMRGVGSAPAPDPGWVGKVAATERTGFIDGGAIVRLPEVVVYTAGG